MATSNYSWNLPTVGGSEDEWGTQLNANWTDLDTLLGGVTQQEFALLSGQTSLVPSGVVIWHAANTAPPGFLKANGAAVSRATYADLFSAIGTTFGAGDGSTTFDLPDLRGEFIRGWDDSRGIDSGRLFGSAQVDQLQEHSHGIGEIQATFGAGTANRERVNNNQGRQSATSGSNGRFGSETRPRNVALLACIKF